MIALATALRDRSDSTTALLPNTTEGIARALCCAPHLPCPKQAAGGGDHRATERRCVVTARHWCPRSPPATLATPEADSATGTRALSQLKEFVMNDMQDLEIVDLGDVKEVTMGPVAPHLGEDHPSLIFREQ